jgi:exodeoxyribonuclease V beta subunit
MQLSGLMRGFIDMVVRHRGQYFIVDYKSNRLGTTLAYYQQAALQRAIQAHHYDLQYLIYTVALHRYLKTRIPDYNYERDFGGVYYLFLRGMRPGQSSGVWFDRPAAPLIEQLDLAFEGPLK